MYRAPSNEKKYHFSNVFPSKISKLTLCVQFILTYTQTNSPNIFIIQFFKAVFFESTECFYKAETISGDGWWLARETSLLFWFPFMSIVQGLVYTCTQYFHNTDSGINICGF